jgi:hypothetical protein
MFIAISNVVHVMAIEYTHASKVYAMAAQQMQAVIASVVPCIRISATLPINLGTKDDETRFAERACTTGL